MSAIITKDLTKCYGARLGVQDLSLSIDPGTVFGFLGPNGSGKSTAIRLLLGFLRPTSGHASVLGLDCWRDSHRIKKDTGYISGDLRLYPWMTAKSALSFSGQARGENLLGQGLELAEYFELDPSVPVRKMSRGMRQKVGLLLALAHKPKVLVLDEPTTALDPPMQQALYDHLRRRAAEGATVFFSSHTLSEVEDLCDTVAILRKGRLVAHERLETLREQACRAVTLTWNSADTSKNANVPPYLKVLDRDTTTWNCSLDGKVMDLVRWAADQPLNDLTVSPPDLNSLFHSYYHNEAKS